MLMVVPCLDIKDLTKMPVRISISTEDNIEDLSAVEIKKELVEHFGLKDCEVKVSKLTMRQYKKVTESK